VCVKTHGTPPILFSIPRFIVAFLLLISVSKFAIFYLVRVKYYFNCTVSALVSVGSDVGARYSGQSGCARGIQSTSIMFIAGTGLIAVPTKMAMSKPSPITVHGSA
jgi:hypothetical protein